MNRKSEQNNVFERKIERTEDSTSLGISKHTSILSNDLYPPYRSRRRTISAAESIQMRLEIDPQSTIVNGSTSIRSRSSSSSLATDSQAENSNGRRFHFTFLQEEQESSTTRRSGGGGGHRSAPSILQRSEDNVIGNDSPDNPTGLNEEWSSGE